MKKVSVETGQKLKKAGLVWGPKEGDWFSCGDQNYLSLVHFQTKLTSRQWVSVSDETWPEGRIMTMEQLLKENAYWLPTFDDLLEWLEGRGYFMHITNLLADAVKPGTKCWEVILFDAKRSFRCNTLVEAAAQAVLWALEQEGERFAK